MLLLLGVDSLNNLISFTSNCERAHCGNIHILRNQVIIVARPFGPPEKKETVFTEFNVFFKNWHSQDTDSIRILKIQCTWLYLNFFKKPQSMRVFVIWSALWWTNKNKVACIIKFIAWINPFLTRNGISHCKSQNAVEIIWSFWFVY